MEDKIDKYLKEAIAARFPEGRRNSAYIYCLVLLQLFHGDYIAVTQNVVMTNFLPTSDKKFVTLLRVVADLIERLHNEDEVYVKSIVAELKRQILKEME